LKPNEVKRLRGTLDGWDCRDLKFFIGTVNFDDVDRGTRDRLNKVETRLALPTKQVDLTIAAGSQALRNDTAFAAALASMRPGAGGADPMLTGAVSEQQRYRTTVYQ
jgi:hypothetical protein